MNTIDNSVMSEEKAIQIGIQAGLKIALETIDKIKTEKMKARFDRRLRNTKLLLQNYRNLMQHCEDAIYEIQNDPYEILDQIDDQEDDLYIESIKRTKDRTSIILNHINKMMDVYRLMAEKSNKQEELRRYKIIKAMYIDIHTDGNNEIFEKNVEDIAEEHCINVRTLYRDRNLGMKQLSILLFGIDSLKISY